jgi:uncharacterized protein YbjT (DUF2867 family)
MFMTTTRGMKTTSGTTMRGATTRRTARRCGLGGLLRAGLAIAGLALAAALPAAALAQAGTAAAPSPAAAGDAREVLVFGGTGQLGVQIVRRLVAAGHRVTVFARPGSDRSRLQGLGVDYVTGDLLNPGDVAAAFESRRFAVVVNAVRVEDNDPHFYEKIMGPIATQAKANRVAQVIHHGAVGAGANVAKFTTLGWDKVPGLLPRLVDQGIGEQRLREGGVPWTIIRNARLYPDERPATGQAELTEDDSVLTPMTRADLAILTVRCVGNPACYGKTYHVKDASLPWPPPGAAAR